MKIVVKNNEPIQIKDIIRLVVILVSFHLLVNIPKFDRLKDAVISRA